MTQAVPLVVVLVGVFVAAVTDIWRFKVHNALTFSLLISGIVYHWMFAGGVGLLNSVLGVFFGAGVLFVFHAMGGVGAGDVKLVAALGAWLGLLMTMLVFIASALAAGFYAFVLLMMYGRMRETWVNLQVIWYRIAAAGRHLAAEDRVEEVVSGTARRRRVIPFAAMVAVGLVAILVWSLFDRLPFGASFR